MPTISSVLSALGLAPKTLPQAREIIEPARATLDSVSALFASAGLPLDEMLAAGPDSLKAHLARLERENEQEIAVLTSERDTLAANLAANVAQVETLNSQLSALNSQLSTYASIFAAVGMPDTGSAADLKSAFASHIEKQASAILAKDGRPPVAFVPRGTEETSDEDMTDEQLVAKYEKMPVGSARYDFALTHFDAISRGQLARRQRRN